MKATVAPPTTTLATLKATEAWLDDKSHWTTGTYWRDLSGRDLSVDPAYREDVRSTCARGALMLFGGVSAGAAECWSAAADTLAAELGGHGIVCVNDGAADGYDRIMAALRRAIDKLEAT